MQIDGHLKKSWIRQNHPNFLHTQTKIIPKKVISSLSFGKNTFIQSRSMGHTWKYEQLFWTTIRNSFLHKLWCVLSAVNRLFLSYHPLKKYIVHITKSRLIQVFQSLHTLQKWWQTWKSCWLIQCLANYGINKHFFDICHYSGVSWINRIEIVYLP